MIVCQVKQQFLVGGFNFFEGVRGGDGSIGVYIYQCLFCSILWSGDIFDIELGMGFDICLSIRSVNEFVVFIFLLMQ